MEFQESAEHLYVIRDIKGLDPVAITSRTINKAEKLADEFKINNICKNYKILIEKYNPDALLILVSPEHIFSVTNKDPITVSHPCGSYNNSTLKILYQLGIKIGFRSNFQKLNHNDMEFPRVDHSHILLELN